MRTGRPVAAFALLVLTGCSGGTSTAAQSSEPPSPVTESEAASATSSSSPGTPFNLTVHCGGRDARFEGRDWVASTELPTLTPVSVDGVSTGLWDVDGQMTKLSDDRLRFTIDDDDVVETGQFVEFVPNTGAPPPACE